MSRDIWQNLTRNKSAAKIDKREAVPLELTAHRLGFHLAQQVDGETLTIRCVPLKPSKMHVHYTSKRPVPSPQPKNRESLALRVCNLEDRRQAQLKVPACPGLDSSYLMHKARMFSFRQVDVQNKSASSSQRWIICLMRRVD